MTTAQEVLSALPRKRVFHDRHEERSYLLAVETARRVLDDPTLLARGTSYIEQFMSPDPRQATYAALWREVLAEGADGMARRLLANDDDGRVLRASIPVFVTFSPADLAELWSSTRA